MDLLSLRVAARWQHASQTSRVASRWHLADQPPGQRKHVDDLTGIINKPRGISPSIIKDYGKSKDTGEGITTPAPDDIRPQDLFDPEPGSTGVRNLAETGRDLSHALDKQVPKDKGYETVRNLSQYLVRTEGGAEGGPEGKKP